MASSLELCEKGLSLPFELIENILYRIPIESIQRFKAVCKQWHALFNDKRFIYKHLDFSHARFIRIYRDIFQIINPMTLDLLCLKVPADFLLGNRNIFNYVIHCDGLLLCQLCVTWGCYELAVWNPVLNQIKLIEPLDFKKPFDLLGFGYDNVSRESYKILRVDDIIPKFEIFDLKSKVWRVFPATFDCLAYKPLQNVSMKGNMYWIAETKGDTKRTFIQSFDFSKNIFKPICSFPFVIEFDFVHGFIFNMVALACFRGDRLSFLYRQIETREIEMWVTNKVTDKVVSWSKYINVITPDLSIMHPLTYYDANMTPCMNHKTNSIVLLCEKVVEEENACYEIGESEIKTQVETGHPYVVRGMSENLCICSCVYIPSMVPIP